MNVKQILSIMVAMPGLLVCFEAQAFYNSDAGRWLNRDPINESGRKLVSDRSNKQFYRDEDLHLYRIIANDPVNRVDPFGLKSFDETDCANAQPTSDKNVCSIHKGVKHTEADIIWDAECVCRCAGTNDWDNKVRGCLACAQRQGVPPGEAHERCYALADEVYPVQGTLSRLNIGATCGKCQKRYICPISGIPGDFPFIP